MKITLVCFLIVIGTSFISLGIRKYPIKFTITSTSSYCQGAAPSQEMLNKLRQPIPLKGKMIFIREGNTNNMAEPVVANPVTDSLGNFTIHLLPGIYCIVDEKKKDKTYYDQLIKSYGSDTPNQKAIDRNCLDKWLATPDFIFEVKKASQEFTYNYNKGCFWTEVPCSQYTGPLPP